MLLLTEHIHVENKRSSLYRRGIQLHILFWQNIGESPGGVSQKPVPCEQCTSALRG